MTKVWTLQHTSEWFTVKGGLIKDVNTVSMLLSTTDWSDRYLAKEAFAHQTLSD